MAQVTFDEEVKTRLPTGMKKQLEAEAERQQVKPSHVVREALKAYLAPHQPSKVARPSGR